MPTLETMIKEAEAIEKRLIDLIQKLDKREQEELIRQIESEV